MWRVTVSDLRSPLRNWLIEPAALGYAAAGLVAVHLAPALEPDAMRQVLGRLNALAFQVALAVSAWRICLGPAVRGLVAATRSLERDDDDQHDAR